MNEIYTVCFRSPYLSHRDRRKRPLKVNLLIVGVGIKLDKYGGWTLPKEPNPGMGYEIESLSVLSFHVLPLYTSVKE